MPTQVRLAEARVKVKEYEDRVAARKLAGDLLLPQVRSVLASGKRAKSAGKKGMVWYSCYTINIISV